MVGFVKQLSSVGWRLFKSDRFFQLSSLLYIGAGVLSLLESALKDSGEFSWPTLLVWNLGVLFSVLFLAFASRSMEARKKMVVSLGAVLLFLAVHIGTAAVKQGECSWRALVGYENWWMIMGLLSLLFGTALKRPNGPAPFDELAPFRLLRFMMEAGLITGAVTLLGYINLTCLCAVWGENWRIINKIIRDVALIFLCVVCPLYVACRFMSLQGRNVKPGSVFGTAFSWGWTSLQVSLIFFSCSAVLTFWWQPPSSGGLVSCLWSALFMWWALAFVPESVRERDVLMNKIFRMFRTILPYMSLLYLLYIGLLYLQKWRVKFLLDDDNVWTVLMALAFFLSSLIWQKRKSLSSKGLFQAFAFISFAACFWPATWWNPNHAEEMIFSKLQKLEVVDNQGQLTKTEVKMSLSSDERDSFMLAVMTLVNDSHPSQRVRTLLKQMDNLCQQQKREEGQKGHPNEKLSEENWPDEVCEASSLVQACFTEKARIFRNFLAFCHVTFPVETRSLHFDKNRNLRMAFKHEEQASYSLRTWLRKERALWKSKA